MFFSKKLLQKIAIFIVVYVFLTLALTILYFYLGSLYPEDLGLNSNEVAKWSRYDLISIFLGVGAFMAPISVLLGFNIWKNEHFNIQKIKVVDELKSILIKQRKLLDKFWEKDIVKSMCSARKSPEQQSEVQREFESVIKQFESLRMEIAEVLEEDGFYFGIDSLEIQKNYQFLDDLCQIIDELEISFSLLKKVIWDEFAVTDHNKDEYYQALYFISPQGFSINKLKNQGRVNANNLSEQKKIKILSKINKFYKYLNDILHQIYNS